MHWAGDPLPEDLQKLNERTNRALEQDYNYAPMSNRMWGHLMTLGDSDRAFEAMLEESGPPEPKTWRPPMPASCRPAVEEPAPEPTPEPVEEPEPEPAPVVEEPAPVACAFRMGTLKSKPKSSKKKGKKR